MEEERMKLLEIACVSLVFSAVGILFIMAIFTIAGRYDR
jgi:hypothetical protein